MTVGTNRRSLWYAIIAVAALGLIGLGSWHVIKTRSSNHAVNAPMSFDDTSARLQPTVIVPTLNPKRTKALKDQEILGKDLAKHNLRAAASRGWTLIAWTDGAIYPPGFPISVSLRLVPDDQQNKKEPELLIKLRTSPVVGRGFSRESDPKPNLKLVKRELFGWEMEVKDAFNSSIPPSYEVKRSGAEAFERGAYLITILLKLNDEIRLEIQDVPIAVLRKGDANTYWKTNPHHTGDFLPELNKETRKSPE